MWLQAPAITSLTSVYHNIRNDGKALHITAVKGDQNLKVIDPFPKLSLYFDVSNGSAHKPHIQIGLERVTLAQYGPTSIGNLIEDFIYPVLKLTPVGVYQGNVVKQVRLVDRKGAGHWMVASQHDLWETSSNIIIAFHTSCYGWWHYRSNNFTYISSKKKKQIRTKVVNKRVYINRLYHIETIVLISCGCFAYELFYL